jgi:hypothetical protein
MGKGLRLARIGGFLLGLSLVAASTATALAAPSSAPSSTASAPADSSLVWRWAALYRNRLDVIRASNQFLWNDEETSSHLNDRLAVLGELTLRDQFTFFAKGATGFRLESDYEKEQLVLEQGHAGFKFLGEGVQGRLFMRERMFRTDLRLMEILSNDAAFFRDGGDGLSLELKAGSHLRMQYLGAAVRSFDEIGRSGGLPLFRGAADAFHMVRFEALERSRWHAGVLLSQTRSLAYGDAVTVGADVGARFRGVGFVAELARAQSGSWEELREGSLFDLRLSTWRLDRLSSVFSEKSAFSAEAEGLVLRLGGAGSAGIVPGYRYSGRAFMNAQGEVGQGINETYAIAWWKPAAYDALVSLDGVDGSRGDESARRLIERLRLGCRGGLEFRENIMWRAGKRAAVTLSLQNDTKLSRLRMTLRIDEFGRENELSYLAEGGINFSPSVAANGVLYLYQSRMSSYSFGFEFRPRQRFLFRLALGSFIPTYEELMLGESFEFDPPLRERSVLLSSRIWFGGM